MTTPTFRKRGAAMAVALAAVVLTRPAGAYETKGTEPVLATSPAERAPHDFTGAWGSLGGDHSAGVKFAPDIVPPIKVLSSIDDYLQPWAVEKHKEFNHLEYDLGKLQETPEADCMPFSMPGERQETRLGFQYITTPAVWLIIGGNNNFRLIHIDRSHPKTQKPTWMGHTIGHWEGNTLVTDTIGFNAKGTIEDGVHHTDKLHMTGRYSLTSEGKAMQIVYTYDDPGSTTRTFKFARVLPLFPNATLVDQEDRCEGRPSY